MQTVSVGSLKACMERLPSDVYAIANQKKDPQGRTLTITANDLPTKKVSTPYIFKKNRHKVDKYRRKAIEQ